SADSCARPTCIVCPASPMSCWAKWGWESAWKPSAHKVSHHRGHRGTQRNSRKEAQRTHREMSLAKSEIKAILTHNVVSMRLRPDSDSELVSRGVMGDRVILLEERDDFALVRSYDDYEGWVWRRHLRPALPDEPLALPMEAPRAARLHRIQTPWAHVF